MAVAPRPWCPEQVIPTPTPLKISWVHILLRDQPSKRPSSPSLSCQTQLPDPLLVFPEVSGECHLWEYQKVQPDRTRIPISCCSPTRPNPDGEPRGAQDSWSGRRVVLCSGGTKSMGATRTQFPDKYLWDITKKQNQNPKKAVIESWWQSSNLLL